MTGYPKCGGGKNMAQVKNFIYCLNSNTNEVEANAIVVLSAITPEYIPGTFSFSIFCSIVDLEDGNHNIAYNLLHQVKRY